MRPIEQKTEINFSQALRCVEYRLPRAPALKRSSYIHALALRYGLMGAAASHHLLLSSKDEEEAALIDAISHWPEAVQEHFRWELMQRLPIETSPFLPAQMANLAYQPVVTYLDCYRKLCPLADCLEKTTNEYLCENQDDIRTGWSWFQSGRAVRLFKSVAEESMRYALNFFDRRQAGLDEVAEIALLGE